MRCVVTGGSGFIGSHVVDALVAAGHEVTSLGTTVRELNSQVRYVRGSILDDAALAEAFADCEAVFHCAAVGDADRFRADPTLALRTNVEGVLRVCLATAAAGARRVVLAGTGWVYGAVPAGTPLPLAEDAALRQDQVEHLYTASKVSAEAVLWSACSGFGLEGTVLRYGSPYGPRMRSALVAARFVAQARSGQPLTLAGGGHQQRSFLYVTDLAAAHPPALAPSAAGATINLESSERHSIADLARAVAEEVGDTSVLVTPGRAGDYANRPVSTALAADLLDWQATTPLRDGLRAYLAWLDGPEAAAYTWG